MGEDRHDSEALCAVYRAGNDAVSAAYQLGIEHGRKMGYEEQARDHHQWLLSHDERMAQVAEDAARFALMDAADAWDSEAESDNLTRLAKQHYRAGGPSMPTIWLRLRAESNPPTDAPTPPPTGLAGETSGDGA